MKRLQERTRKSCSLIAAVLAPFAAGHIHADQLLRDNGLTDGNTLGWGETSTTMDDFVVPSGGWWIESAQTSGIFLGTEDVIDVQLAIWPHDYDEDEPNGDTAFMLDVTDWSAVPTGEEYSGYDEIQITVDFEPTYLQGSKKYWIEFIVIDSYGMTRFRFLAREDIELQPAWLHFGQGSLSTSEDAMGEELDLAYRLYGTDVTLNGLFWAPGSLNITIGQGDGGLEDLGGVDALDYQIWRRSFDPPRVQMVATGQATTNEIGHMILVVESAALQAPSVIQTIELWNYDTRRWERVSRLRIRREHVATIVELENAAPYLSPQGDRTRARFTWAYTGSDQSRPFGVSIDQINWAVYPGGHR